MDRIKRENPGQLLVEVMIAVAVVMVGLLAIMQISRKSVNNTGFSEKQAVATTYASEAVEWVRGQQTILGWKDISAKSNSTGLAYCLNASNLTWPATTGACPGYTLENLYKRNLTLKSSDIGVVPTILVTVTVSWQEGSRTSDANVPKVTQDTTLVKY